MYKQLLFVLTFLLVVFTSQLFAKHTPEKSAGLRTGNGTTPRSSRSTSASLIKQKSIGGLNKDHTLARYDAAASMAGLAPSVSVNIVISQVYGGAGCGTANCSTYKNDYIELFNRGTSAVNVNGWSVQYAAATGTAWQVTPLPNVSIPAGGYLLVAESFGANGVNAIPTADIVGTIAMSATAAKVALVNVTTALTGACPSGATIIDLVGYGTTPNCNEGGANAPAPGTTTAAIRLSNGCTDTDNNSTDFATGTPNPRNLSSPINLCNPIAPVLTASPASRTGVNGLAYIEGSGPASTTVSVSGSTFNTATGTITATSSSTAFTVSPPTAPFSGSALAATTFTVQLEAGLTAASSPYSGTITFEGGGATAVVPVSGTVSQAGLPQLSATPTTLSGFTATQGTASQILSYTLSGNNLSNDVTVTAPVGAEVASTTTAFGSTLNVPVSGGTLSETPIFVRLTNATSAGVFSGTVTNVSGSKTATVALSGTVTTTGITPIAAARTLIGQNVTIQGRVTVTNQLGSRQIYIQDATGGIAVYSGPSGPDFTSLVQLGDLVQTSGPITVFNGALELTGTGNFTVVSGAGTVIPTPISITPNQLADHQGELVSIVNATITPVAGTFSGGTNYTVTAGVESSSLRISANSPLAGAGQPTNPVSVTGIADRFVSAATTTGTNGMQIQPRILADIPGSTPALDMTCTVGSGSTLTRDQTLDIAAWNMEFFGADAGTITCPPSKTLVYNDMGPVNEDLQQSNAVTVLTKLNADIIATEEVSDIDRFDAAVKSIPGSFSYVCSDKFSYFFQDECTQVPTGNPATVFGPTKFAQKVCVIYNMATVTPILAETKPLLFQKTADYTYPGGNGWASGRLPFLFVANATINGVTKKVHVVVVHGKSGSASDDFSRRVQDYNDLKAELDQNYPTANVVILGDYNDKATTSIYTGSPISSFNSFVTDAANYNVITKPLEQNGCATYNPSGGSFIDHITISNDLQPAYVSNTAYVLQPFSIPNYGNTTSDHSPIEARFDLSQLAGPVSATLVASASAVCTGQPVNFSITVDGLSNGNTYSYTVSNGTNSTNATGVSASAVQTSLIPTVPGAFTLTVLTSANASTTAASGNVTINTITATATASATTALVGSAISLSATGGTTYQWTSSPGATLSTPTTDPVISATLTSPGTQTFTVLVTNGSCSQSLSVSVAASYQTVDLMPTILVDNLNFAPGTEGVTRDFVVSINEVSNQPSGGTIAFKIAKLSAFAITYSTNNGTSNVGNGIANTNGSWTFSEDTDYITVQTNASFSAFSNQIVGFSIARKDGIPPSTVQSINITIVPNAGNEQNFGNNIAVTSVTAN